MPKAVSANTDLQWNQRQKMENLANLWPQSDDRIWLNHTWKVSPPSVEFHCINMLPLCYLHSYVLTTSNICQNHHNRWMCEKFARCKFFQLKSEKVIHTQCKILHKIFVMRQLLLHIYTLSSVKFLDLKLRLCKKITNGQKVQKVENEENWFFAITSSKMVKNDFIKSI